MSVKSQWLDILGMRIHCLVAGEQGSPVVLLHGGGIDSASLSWGMALEPLAAAHRVFAPDLPGYGQSDKSAAEYTTAFYTDFLDNLLDALQLPKTALVGLSMGGAIATGFTLDHPGRVGRLVLVDPYGIQARVAWQKLSYLIVMTPINELSYAFFRSKSMVRWLVLSTLISSPARLSEALVDELCLELRKPGVGKAWASFQRHEISWNGVRTNYLPRLAEISVPTLIIHGEKDTTVLVQCARDAQARVKNSRLAIMAECKHWPMRDKPEEFNRLIDEFLGETQ